MDYAIEARRAMIKKAVPMITTEQRIDAQIDRLASGLEAKRIRAINTLGKRWVLHPEYDSKRNAHHNSMNKGSAILTAFLHYTGAIAGGRV